MGGIKDDGAERVFLISTTHGAEMCGLGALLKVIEIYKRDNVTKHLWSFGEKLINGANAVSKEMGLEKYFYFEGVPCSPNYVTKNSDLEVSLDFRTLFAQEMIKHKVLMPWVAISMSHGEQELDQTLCAIRSSLSVYAQALESGVSRYLQGKSIRPVFRARN